MKITNTFITVADDSPASMGTVPPLKSSLARQQYDLLSQHPYEYDLDALNFEVYCRRNGLTGADCEAHREAFFSKGHPCMRASPLTRSYGYGAHYDSHGRIALYPVDSRAYHKLVNDPANKVEMAMRTHRPSAEPASSNPGLRMDRLHTAA